jgi:hypothetical protein
MACVAEELWPDKTAALALDLSRLFFACWACTGSPSLFARSGDISASHHYNATLRRDKVDKL